MPLRRVVRKMFIRITRNSDSAAADLTLASPPVGRTGRLSFSRPSRQRPQGRHHGVQGLVQRAAKAVVDPRAGVHWAHVVPRTVALVFAINLAANLVFTPIQFGLRNLPLASIDILIIWGTIIWMVMSVWTFHRWIAFAQIPYFAWVSVASVLQLSITWMNRGS